MNRNHSIIAPLCAGVAVLLAALPSARGWFDMYGSGPVPQPRLQPAYRAEEFVDAVGLSAALGDNFYELGIRHYRAGLWDTTKGRENVPQRAADMAAAWEKYGVRPMLLLDSLRDKPEQALAMIKLYPPGLVAAVEGGNEVNNKFPPQVLNTKYGGKTDEAGGAAFMADLVRLLRADPVTKDIPVVSFTAIFSDYRLARPHTAFDFGNIHSYQGNGVPSSSLEMNITRFNNILPAGGVIRPFVPTECGYNVEADRSNGTGLTGSLQAQARNIPMLLAEYFRHGIPRSYLFALHNADGYGLLESDSKTRRPAWFAVRNFMAALKDATWNPAVKRWEGGRDFTLRALLFDLPGAPQDIHTLVLQKRSGEYSLLIWNEMENYDGNAKRDRENPPVAVTVRFQTPVLEGATILTQNAQGGYETNATRISGGCLTVQVPSSVMIIRLRPAAKAPNTMLPAPTQLASEATETEARLRWQAVPGAAGYFIFRNGWHLSTTTGTEFADTSSWLRPGLGYTYEVQAFAPGGAMSARSTKVVQTPARFPDVVATEIGPEKAGIRPGDQVRMTATLKNIGQGSTPNNIAISATWQVDGKTVGFSGVTGPFKPGEERTVAGGSWTATEGAHVLKCVIDDINRLPGEAKANNVCDRTIFVGEPARGLLLGSTKAAPSSVDLSAEGTLDWVHWGVADKTNCNRKTGANLIDGRLTKQGEGYCDRTAGGPVGMSWTGGTPSATGRDDHAGLWWNFPGTSQSFTVAADTTERVLKVYVAGIEGAACSFTATLSDNSAPPYVSSAWDGNAAMEWAAVPDGFSGVYTVRYRAASPGEQLTVTWKLAGEPNRFLGQARLQAATLAAR